MSIKSKIHDFDVTTILSRSFSRMALLFEVPPSAPSRNDLDAAMEKAARQVVQENAMNKLVRNPHDYTESQREELALLAQGRFMTAEDIDRKRAQVLKTKCEF